MTITCDICERTEDCDDVSEAEQNGWIIAEDEPDATERHGLCPDCPDDSD